MEDLVQLKTILGGLQLGTAIFDCYHRIFWATSATWIKLWKSNFLGTKLSFAVRMKKAGFLATHLNAQWRLWSDSADAQADLRLRWAHSHFVGFVVRWHKFTHFLLISSSCNLCLAASASCILASWICKMIVCGNLVYNLTIKLQQWVWTCCI